MMIIEEEKLKLKTRYLNLKKDNNWSIMVKSYLTEFQKFVEHDIL